MRVLLVHGRYRSAAPSGENNVVDQESAALAEAGHEVELFQRHSDEIAGWSLPQKAALPIRSVWNREARKDLTRRLAQYRPDVVHVHNTFPLLSPSVLAACHDAGVPVVTTLHNYKLLCASGDFFRDGSPCHACAAGRVSPGVAHGCYRGSRLATVPVATSLAVHRSTWRELVSAYVFISRSQRDLMRGLDLPEDRVFVKHNFVRAAAVRTEAPDHQVVYLGRLDAAKGVPLLMRSWDAFRARHPESELRLTIAGGGPIEEGVRRWAAGHPSVEVAGLLPPAAAAALVQRAVAVIVPSQWEETFGLVAVEAMAAGVAPVAPARGSFPELISDGEDGTLFTPGDPVSLADVLEGVDRDPQEHLDRGTRGRATYERRFTRAANLAELVAIYEFAVENPAGRTGARPLGDRDVAP